MQATMFSVCISPLVAVDFVFAASENPMGISTHHKIWFSDNILPPERLLTTMPTEAQHTFPMTNHHLSPHQPLGRPAESPEHISAEQDPHTGNAFDSSVHPDEDWIEVSDLAERGQIQNRVAQRNHRTFPAPSS